MAGNCPHHRLGQGGPLGAVLPNWGASAPETSRPWMRGCRAGAWKTRVTGRSTDGLSPLTATRRVAGGDRTGGDRTRGEHRSRCDYEQASHRVCSASQPAPRKSDRYYSPQLAYLTLHCILCQPPTCGPPDAPRSILTSGRRTRRRQGSPPSCARGFDASSLLESAGAATLNQHRGPPGRVRVAMRDGTGRANRASSGHND